MGVGLGDPAPAFRLSGTGPDPAPGEYSLEDYAGSPVVLVFYPADDTPVCIVQLSSYSKDISSFVELGTQLLAISPQGVESHRAFADRHGLGFPLLADEDKAVGRAYGVLGPLGFYRRSVFVVDGGGIIRYASRRLSGLGFTKSDELVEAVRKAS